MSVAAKGARAIKGGRAATDPGPIRTSNKIYIKMKKRKRALNNGLRCGTQPAKKTKHPKTIDHMGIRTLAHTRERPGRD